jgi:hypothetical protein
MRDMISRQEPLIRFVGEQDGQPERELKLALCRLFVSGNAVHRAYLVRVNYGDPSITDVALALNSVPEGRDELLADIQGVFHSMFGIGQHLDIFFVLSTQEAEISLVCRPFFGAALQ